MEDDDEFGDLYSDVVPSFPSVSTPTSSVPQPPQASAAAPSSFHRTIDLNIKSDDTDIIFEAHGSNSADRNVALDSIPGLGLGRDSAAEPRVLDIRGGKLRNLAMKMEIDVGKDVKFDIEEGNGGIGDLNSDPIIPGLSESVVPDDSKGNTLQKENEVGGNEEDMGGEGDDWDSDREDDLQIVLNDNSHAHMAMEGGVMREDDDDDDDDEDGDLLVIVADGDVNQGMEEQDWGEEAAQGAEGERKEGGEPGKPIGGVSGGVITPKIGYSHGYHPFHSHNLTLRSVLSAAVVVQSVLDN